MKGRHDHVDPIFRPLLDSFDRLAASRPTGRVPQTDPLELHIRHGLQWMTATTTAPIERCANEARREFRLAARHAFRKRPDLRPPTSAAMAGGRRRHATKARPRPVERPLPEAVRIGVQTWVGGFYSAELIDASTGATCGGCMHRHRTRVAAMTCGRRILRRRRRGGE